MSLTVSHEEALNILRHAWDEIESKKRPPARMQQLIEQILASNEITFKYILVTGYLAKVVNKSINARALQVKSKLKGAYDARSLCHKVVVGFEKTKGNLFGLSNEPFVNKPARHPEHDGKNSQLRNKVIAQKLHEALEMANSRKPTDNYNGLIHILRIGHQHAVDYKVAKVAVKTNLVKVTKFITDFLSEADGGSRLVSIWGAIMALISENGNIVVNSPNASDKFGKIAGDVQMYYNGVLLAASECKHRPLNLDDVKHGIKKAKDKGVPEYHFIIAAGLERGQEQNIITEINLNSSEIDILLVDIWQYYSLLAGILNPIRRAVFGEKVVELLRLMRKFDSANEAAELWNKITC